MGPLAQVCKRLHTCDDCTAWGGSFRRDRKSERLAQGLCHLVAQLPHPAGGQRVGGPVALFAGPSGTGKTLAASVIAQELAAALGLGLLIGVVRERRLPEVAVVAGLRTHALVALAGAVSLWIGIAAFVVALLVVGTMAALSYRHSGGDDPGLTGEIGLHAAPPKTKAPSKAKPKLITAPVPEKKAVPEKTPPLDDDAQRTVARSAASAVLNIGIAAKPSAGTATHIESQRNSVASAADMPGLS